MWVGIPDQAQPAVDAKVQSLPPGLSRGWLFEDVRRHVPSRRISDSLLDYTTRLYIMMSEVLNNTLKSEIWIHSELWKACDDIHSFIQCFAGLSSVILLQGFQFHATEHAHTHNVSHSYTKPSSNWLHWQLAVCILIIRHILTLQRFWEAKGAAKAPAPKEAPKVSECQWAEPSMS